MRYQIRSGRVNFADFVKRRELIQEGRLLGQNAYPPDNDASILTNLQEGELNTTPAELASYLAEVAPTPSATVPDPPTSLSATGGDGEITISFTPGSDGGSAITNYEYFSVDVSGATWEPFSPAVTTSPVVITGLPNGQTLQFKLRAVNAYGPSAESAIVSGTTLTTPSAPTSLLATAGNGQVSVSFTAGSDGGSAITNYKYSTNNGSTYTAFSPAVTASPVTITGLTNGTTYQIKLLAVNAVGDGAESSAVSGTPSTVPTAPTSLSATAGNTQLSISFTAGSNGGSVITNYKYSTDNGSTYTAFSPVTTSSPVTITGLSNGTTYQVKLRAVNANGDGAESSAVSGTPSAPGDAIVASLTTSLAAYTAAATNDWVSITSTEYTALQTNVTGTSKAGIVDAYFSLAGGGGLTATDQSALVANGVTANTPAISANTYLYGFAVRWSNVYSGTDLRVFANTNTSSSTGFNQVGNILPATTTGGAGAGTYYYVRKGVSATNGATNGLLSIFTGTTPTKSGGYIAFYQNFSINAPMKYKLFTPASAGNPDSTTIMDGNLTGYGMFGIQGLTTATKQWA
jgi:hypothetical protein